MSITGKSAILSRNGKGPCRMQLIPLFLVLAGTTWQLASFGQTLQGPDNRHANISKGAMPQIPDGYILPAQIDRTLSVENVRAGDVIEARIVQEVPLPNREKIAFRSVLKGSVLKVVRDEDEIGVELTVRFDVVSHRGQNLAVVTSLRAIASHIAVRDAQLPVGAYDEAFPRWANTVQIGGDVRYGDGHSVRDRWNQTVGKAVLGGVLVDAKANPALGCERPSGADDRPQALWVFSADACGIYGFEGVEIVHNGQSEPVGKIILHFKKAAMKLRAGTGMLLCVVSQP